MKSVSEKAREIAAEQNLATVESAFERMILLDTDHLSVFTDERDSHHESLCGRIDLADTRLPAPS